MRILGLDYGSKTVGVAVTDELGLTGQNLETIFRTEETKLRRTLSRIGEIIREYDVSLIVLGLPLNMDGTAGKRAEKTLEDMCRDSWNWQSHNPNGYNEADA